MTAFERFTQTSDETLAGIGFYRSDKSLIKERLPLTSDKSQSDEWLAQNGLVRLSDLKIVPVRHIEQIYVNADFGPDLRLLAKGESLTFSGDEAERVLSGVLAALRV